LVHQWFLELLRRFNLWFHIFDEARCAAIEAEDSDANPFLDDQLLLCDPGLLTTRAERLEQALAAGWDMVVVDEAHHLGWSASAPSPEYAAVERLGQVAPGLLLLTATPEQLGVASHFARLRLLDPNRFQDLDQFIHESAEFQSVAHLARLLNDGSDLSGADRTTLATVLGESETTVADALDRHDVAVRAEWFGRLLDQHGTGRVMFRNTRATVAGFPSRVAHLYPLSTTSPARHKALAEEWATDTVLDHEVNGHLTFAHDPRIDWLLALLPSLADQKVLLICRTQGKAVAIESALRHRTTIPLAVFHEGLTLVQRDRNAARFADPAGARLLICSEIGSEGRNFQFAHHLVLFDLPLDPAVLEQRIGRLDRIGQHDEIQVHVPYIQGSHLEVLARWYHDGLHAFEEHLPGARELLDRFEPHLRALATGGRRDRRSLPADLDRFIVSVQEARREVAARLEAGRDRLLEWNSFKPALSARVIGEIRRQDDDRTLDEFMLAAFDLFFIEVEELAPRTYRLGSAGVLVDDFPGLKAEGLTCTRDRQRALLREDLQFLTWDHPLATGALDLLLGSEKGNCGFAHWPDDTGSALYLEAVYVLECLAPSTLHVDRFLPPTPLRVVVDHRGREATRVVTPQMLSRESRPAAGQAWAARPDIRNTLLPRLVERTGQLAREQINAIIERARLDMRSRLQHEAARLRAMQKVNRSVRDDEIASIVEQQQALETYIDGARLRLDAVRLIHRGPPR
jgi:ATP-dependent helicase HepA